MHSVSPSGELAQRHPPFQTSTNPIRWLTPSANPPYEITCVCWPHPLRDLRAVLAINPATSRRSCSKRNRIGPRANSEAALRAFRFAPCGLRPVHRVRRSALSLNIKRRPRFTDLIQSHPVSFSAFDLPEPPAICGSIESRIRGQREGTVDFAVVANIAVSTYPRVVNFSF